MNPDFEVYDAAVKIKANGPEVSPMLLKLAESVNIGIWQFDTNDTDLNWTQYHIPTILGYHTDEIPDGFHYFLDNLVHPADRESAFDFFNYYLRTAGKPSAEFRLLTRSMGYRWFKCIGKAWFDDKAHLRQLLGILFSADDQKLELDHLKQKLQLFADSSAVLEAGGWRSDLQTGKISWTSEVYKILEAPFSFRPTLDNLSDFFYPDDRKMIRQAFKEAIQQLKPFNVDARLTTLKSQPVWVTIKGQPITDTYGKCTGLKGSLQKSEHQKDHDGELQQYADFLADQNKRLHNFAHIVSHNLRSYSNNLAFMLSMLDDPDLTEAERPDIFAKIKQLSEKLGTTIHDLDEVVKINTGISQGMTEIDLDECFKNIIKALDADIRITNAVINYDFSACKYLNYVPAYMESIFLNLLTNALKYRHPDRTPEIYCRTFKKDNSVYLEFKDNGIGIDLQKNGEKLFGMYKTFHNNTDAKGIGLFITKNQVEALGGSIDVESTLNIGTKFSIKLT